MRWKLAIIAAVMALLGAIGDLQVLATSSVPPHQYGRVIIDNGSTALGLAPVAFDHWVHRIRVTCRVCHLDLGFAMAANATGISASEIKSGRYCGACHNGLATFGGTAIFAACASRSGATCERCHNGGDRPGIRQTFSAVSKLLPKERFGNRIDWEQAEALGLIQPVGYIEGLSPPRDEREIHGDFLLDSTEGGIPNIIFSHRKHTVWNGCDVCHPNIFLGEKKGRTQYSMQDLFAGKYCGVCHDKVAFPQKDCQRCHTEAVY